MNTFEEMAKKYRYLVEWFAEDAIYIARIVEWPCLAAHGDTAETALAEAEKVVSFAVEDCVAVGDLYPASLS